MDGHRLIRMYCDLGLKLESAASLVESGILEVWQRMTSGRLKVFASLENYLEELRCYRRAEAGQIPMEGDHLQNAARTLVSRGISRMRTGEGRIRKPVQGFQRTYLDEFLTGGTISSVRTGRAQP